MPASAPSVHRYAVVLSDRGRAYPSRIRATGVHRFRRLPFWIIPCRIDTRMPGCLSSRCCRTGFATAQANGLPAVMPPPSRSPLQKIFVTRFLPSDVPYFRVCFQVPLSCPLPAFRVGFTTPIFFHPQFSVSLFSHLLLCYIYGTYMTRHIVPFFIFVSVSSHPFLSSFTVTNLTRIIFLWIISCLFRDTLALSY